MFGVTNVQSINGSDGHKPNTEALDDDYELNSDDQSAPACSDIFTPFTPFTIQKSPQQPTAAPLHCLDVTDAGAGLRSAGGVGAPWSRRHVTTIWSPTLTLDCSRTAASAALAHAGSRHQGFPSPSCSLSTSWIICIEAGVSSFAKKTFMCVSIETNDHT